MDGGYRWDYPGDMDLYQGRSRNNLGALVMTRQINPAGKSLICGFESLKLRAYPDPGTHGVPWTIGWGHTGLDVHPGMVVTEAAADVFLAEDLATAEDFVSHVAPQCTDNQFAALVSFAYNCGRKNLQTSTLLRKHNAGDYAGARLEFAKWCHADGEVMSGLVRRRAAEAALYAAP